MFTYICTSITNILCKVMEIFMNIPYFNLCIFEKPSPLFDNAFEVAPFFKSNF